MQLLFSVLGGVSTVTSVPVVGGILAIEGISAVTGVPVLAGIHADVPACVLTVATVQVVADVSTVTGDPAAVVGVLAFPC